MLKLDMARAFDSAAWPYLMDILRAKGFGPRWRVWIAIILSLASSRILLNGALGPQIWHGRGLRQGDALSPMIFILAMDVVNY